MKFDPWEDAQWRNLSVAKGLIALFLSTLVIVFAALLGFLYHQQVREKQKHDAHYTITHLIHETSTERLLPEDYLAELLQLSVDDPTNLYQFDLEEARITLGKHPCVVEATVDYSPPEALLVRYTMREPVATVGQLTNTAVDTDGNLFPYAPFYDEPSLPILYFNGDPHLALEFLQACPIPVATVDTTLADSLSYGQRQIVVTTRDGKMLRLAPKDIPEQINRYLCLVNSQPDLPFKIIDLRLPQLAYISN